MPLNDNGRNAMLTGGLGNIVTHVAAHTGIPDSTGSNESGGVRQAVAWGTAAAGSRTNSGILTVPVAAGLTIFGIGLWGALTVGTHYGWSPLNSTKKGFATVIAADVTANTLTSSGHGLANTNRVILSTANTETIPAGLNITTVYFVVGSTTDTFQLALTSGGAAIDITAGNEVFFQDLVPEAFASAGNLSIAVAALNLDASVL